MAEPDTARESEGLTQCECEHAVPPFLAVPVTGSKMASPPAPRKTSGDARKGSADNWKGSAETRKGSRDRKKSIELKKDPEEAQKGPGEAQKDSGEARSSPRGGYTGSKKWSFGEDRRGSVDSRRVSVDSRKGSNENRRGSSEDRRGSVDSRRVSVDSRRGSNENRRGSGEDRRGSSEDRDSLSIPASVRPSRLPWATLMRALGRFKLSLPDIRRDYMLASRDPLAVDKELGPRVKYHKVVRRFWGNHQPLAKIPYKILSGHDHTVSSCHFCMDDTRLLSSSYDCSVKLWDSEDGTVMWDFQPRPKAPVLECSITADNRRIVASSYDKSVRVWDVETGQLLWKVRHDTFVVCCKFSPDGKYVLSALDVDRSICLMDPENITTVIQIKDHHKRSITACCFDPDSQKVASVSMDRCIKIWDITSQATLFTIPKAHTNTISDCCFTFSGHFLCTSSWDKNIKIWNIHTGEFRNRGACVTLMKGHEGCVSSCSIARDMVSTGHDDWVTDVAVSNNKKWILSASKDNSLRLWNIEEIDTIPLVTENKRTMGCNVQQCKTCDQIFPAFESDTSSKLHSRCPFCRRNENLGQFSSSSSLEENLES
ncbi:WD repeat-containing protein 88 [Microtus ochrogaster]|uniref:WD repeat-containing protein 88 n=1 Tax=Microtus ochrogaster TaxID=79684 RepID=A0ABM0LLF2_MICOH|nr:WD repeat-containing protein 88 [Microtus ochrogaster]